MELWHILNERERRRSEWRRFRQDERWRNQRHRDLNSDPHGSLRVPGDEAICQIDRSEPEQPIDGNLSW